MLLLFPFLSHSLEPGYTLTPPFERTDVSEIGNWSIRGSAVSWKNAIRLTSDALRDEWGAVCQRVPTAFTEWSIDLELSARGAEQGGESITFLYSDTICPQQPAEFRGFQITIETGKTDKDGFSPVTFSEGTFKGAKQRSVLRIRNLTDTVKLLITKSAKRVSVESTTFMRYKPLFSVELEKMQPDYGYLTVFAVSSASLSDNVNVHGIRTRAYTKSDYSHISEGLLSENRKILESDAVKRREAKLARRNAMLPTMFQYLSTMEKYGNTLGRVAARPDMRDAFGLVQEAAKRGMEAVTIDMLKVFINRYLQDTLAGAGKKVNLAMDKFDEAKGDMTEMWLYLREQLIQLAFETKATLQEIAQQSVQAAKDLHIDHISSESLQTGVAQTSSGGGGSGILVIVMGIELIAYVIFFIAKHRKTGGFKKID
jgi:mannose-binding lectin 1